MRVQTINFVKEKGELLLLFVATGAIGMRGVGRVDWLGETHHYWW